MNQTTSVLDRPEIARHVKLWIQEGETNAGVVLKVKEAFGEVTSEKSIRRFRKRHELQVPGVDKAYTKITGDEAEAATRPEEAPANGRILDNPDKMLRDRGLDPEEWYIDAITVNEWDGPKAGGNTVTYYQAKFTAKRKRPEIQIFAPRTDGWVAPRRAKFEDFSIATRGDRPLLCVVVGDQQAPFQDPTLHALFVEWLAQNEPDWGVSLGDSVDFPDISRHQLDPENTAAVNECLQAGYDMFRAYVEASPDTYWRKLIGNHDERIRNILLDKPKVQPLYGIKRPDTPESEGERLHDLAFAMRLDELGIEVIDPHGKYDLAQINLSDKLAVRHGWLARKGSGASALATLEHLGYSIIVGHTHRQAVVHDTKHEIDGRLRTITGVETGCMCRVEQVIADDGRIWPNYTPAPDWQQGFATVEIWPDGSFNIDTAKYVNGALLWRDQRYTL